jgi:hypothetical protein
MAEYFWGAIAIGGQVKKDLLPDLHKALIEEINDSSQDEIMNDLQACTLKPQPIEYSQSDARWGEFEGIQGFCKKHKIQYLVKSEAAIDCDAQMKYFDGNEEIEVVCSQDFDPTIGKYHFKRYLKLIKEMCADMSLVPLNMDSRNFHEKEVAKAIATTGSDDPLTILEYVIEKRFPDVGDVPALEFID